MADNERDRTNPTAGAGTTPAGNGLGSRGDTQQQAGTSNHASTSSRLHESGTRAAGEAKEYAKDMAGRAKDQSRSMFEQRKHTAASQVDSVAHAFRSAADQLRGDDQSQAGRYVTMAAERLESLSDQLRHKDLDTLMRDAEDLGRRAPMAFFAGSVAAGFLFARFLKSSAEHRYEQRTTSMHEDDWQSTASPAARSDSLSELNRPAGTSASSGSTMSPSAVSGSSNASTSRTMPVGADGTPDDRTTHSGSSAGAASPSTINTGSSTSSTSSSNGSKPGGNSYGNR